MTAPVPKRPGEDDLLSTIDALLADPQMDDNPMRKPLAELAQRYRSEHRRLERLLQIADNYHRVSRDETRDLTEKLAREMRRLRKIARISDRYQTSLMETSEALHRAAVTDPLTGIGNRRFLTEQLERELARTARHGAPLSIGILDIDHFKQFNDRYGHEAGDIALRTVAEQLLLNLRQYDFVGRWGGEEFLLIFPETPLAEADQVGQRIIDQLASVPVKIPDTGAEITLTASLGMTELSRDEALDSALTRADNAMYQAKHGGRNKLQACPPPAIG
ncbi:MAG: biofilm regulation diguanylate cyclase SiaD [Halothiobacillaceae bacterium]